MRRDFIFYFICVICLVYCIRYTCMQRRTLTALDGGAENEGLEKAGLELNGPN